MVIWLTGFRVGPEVPGFTGRGDLHGSEPSFSSGGLLKLGVPF